MNGYEYANTVANYLRNHGYKNVIAATSFSDYCINMSANKHGHNFFILCRYCDTLIDIDFIKEIVLRIPIYTRNKTMIITNSGFTESAKEFAKKSNVILLSGIQPSKFTFHITPIKVILVIAYLLISSAIIFSTVEFVRSHSFWMAFRNCVFSLIFITAPFWSYFLFKKIIEIINTHKRLNEDESNIHETDSFSQEDVDSGITDQTDDKTTDHLIDPDFLHKSSVNNNDIDSLQYKNDITTNSKKRQKASREMSDFDIERFAIMCNAYLDH